MNVLWVERWGWLVLVTVAVAEPAGLVGWCLLLVSALLLGGEWSLYEYVINEWVVVWLGCGWVGFLILM